GFVHDQAARRVEPLSWVRESMEQRIGPVGLAGGRICQLEYGVTTQILALSAQNVRRVSVRRTVDGANRDNQIAGSGKDAVAEAGKGMQYRFCPNGPARGRRRQLEHHP